MIITGKNLIGNLVSSKSNKTFIPLGGNVKEISIEFLEPTPEEITLAATKANEAFLLYRNFSGKKKAGFLEKIAAKLDAEKEQIIPVTQQETKLAIARLQGEMQRTINQIKLFANLLLEGSWINAIIDTAQPERQPL